MKRAVAAAVLLVVGSISVHAQAQEFRMQRASRPPVIDGVLDDEVWNQEPLPLDAWVSYNPLRGDTMPTGLRTEVRIAYDDRNIYFAFHCFDSEPDRIRTTISRRDNAFNDDWIAMSLDSVGTGQTAYHLFVNPSGVQMDALNTTASGEQFDADMVWYSVGKVTTDGYVVELALPLQTIRFAGADDVRMGIVFFRKISRLGISYSWPAMPPGQWVFDAPGHLHFANLKQPPLREILPSATYAINQSRRTFADWGGPLRKGNLGASGKFGVTSNVTFDGTINPDFSQVESDAFQVQLNQRFPIFYSEKRPFFMEGMGLFNIAGTGGDGNMRTAVHTRRIVDRACDLCAARLGLRGRPHDRYGARRAPQPRGWRRRVNEVLGAAAAVGDLSGDADRRRVGRCPWRSGAAFVQLQHASIRVREPAGAL
jgi:uncharacterized protein DUF5916/cellulose/xylan binding protein with CBM9 domain